MADPLSSAAEAAKMMTLVLNTHMKLKAGMVERKITAAKAKCPNGKGAKSLHGRLIVGKAAGRHRKSGGAFRTWCDNCDDVRMME